MRGILTLIVLLLAGCAAAPYGDKPAVEPKETARHGVIESVTPIEMDASSSGSSSIGGLFGQIGGANTGGGRGSVVGTVLGGVLGGTLGHQASIATKPGLEIWVRLDGEEGKSTYVMQPGKPDAFKVGDRVRIVSKGGEVRVELEPAAGQPTAAPDGAAKDSPAP